MARTPKTELTREDKKAQADAAEQDALLREVDDAVRQGDMDHFFSTWGKPLLGVVIAGLAAFGGYIYWNNQQEGEMESASEELILALEQLENNNTAGATTRLEAITGEGSAVLAAKMLRAGQLAEAGNDKEASALLGEVANDDKAPEPMRNLALIRQTSLNFDAMKPADIVAAMQPLAVPGEPFFASAGELLAHAYLAQGKRDEAGALFGEIVRHEDTPRSARARMLNMAGILGVDAVDDVQELLDAQRSTPQGEAELVSQ